jgi:hypothetical protein
MSNLPNLVRTQFQAAQETGDLTFYSTQVAILICNGFTVCIALFVLMKLVDR